MTPLRTIAVWLTCALPLAAAPNAPAAEDASAVAAKIVAAYERGEAVDAAATNEELLVLKAAPLYRKMSDALGRVSAFQNVRTPRFPVCPEVAVPAQDPNGCVLGAARAAAKDLGIAAPARRDSAASLYLARYFAPKNATPAQLSTAQERATRALADPRVSARSAARARRAMAQAGFFTVSGDRDTVEPTGSALSVRAGPGTRGVSAAIAEARRAPRAPSVPVRAIAVPSVSERLAASAREDENILRLGQDDGTMETAIGRSVTQVKKTGSQLLSYFTDGELWRSAGSGAVQMVTNPRETAHYLPGAIKAAGVALWDGVKADISNASDEVGNFIEEPTPYRGAAVLGSVSLAVSNAFVVGGGAKSAVRRGAMNEIGIAAKDATAGMARTTARDSGIGAVEDLGRVRPAAPAAAAAKPVTHPAARDIYLRSSRQAEEVSFWMDQDIIKVSENVTTSAKEQIMFRQTGPTCAFGALCNMYQGVRDVGPQDVLAAIRREQPAYTSTMAKSSINEAAISRITDGLARKAGRTPVTLSSSGDFLRHMRASGQPVLVGVQTGSGRHAIVLSEAMVTKEGKVYFKTLDTNISVRPGAAGARAEKFGLMTADDLDRILATKGFSLL